MELWKDTRLAMVQSYNEDVTILGFYMKEKACAVAVSTCEPNLQAILIPH